MRYLKLGMQYVIRHMKRIAPEVKTSRSSPTGYKFSNGQSCDRHRNPVNVSGGSSGVSSSIVAQTETDLTVLMAQQHIRLPISQRAHSAYSSMVRQALSGDDSQTQIDAHNAIYYGGLGYPASTVAVLDNVINTLDSFHADETQLSEYLQHLQSLSIKGHPVSLPNYYHCTKENQFDAMLSSSHPRVNVSTPRSGTGAAGAWLSTTP